MKPPAPGIRVRRLAASVLLLVSAALAAPATATAQPAAPAASAASTARDATPAAAAASSSAARAARPSPVTASRPTATSTSPANGVAVDLQLPPGVIGTETSNALRIVLGLTLLAIVPALLVCATAFLRIVIVLSMLRHAIGAPETPPNTALIGLALFLTLFTMAPVLQQLQTAAVQPLLEGKLGTQAAWAEAAKPLRTFMAKQTREQDIALMLDLAKAPRPQSLDDVSLLHLVPAFMLSELRAAFQISFVVFLPFLLIDLIVSSLLMALGMMMMPPVTVALPLKLLMFVLADGWSLLLKALVGSFH